MKKFIIVPIILIGLPLVIGLIVFLVCAFVCVSPFFFPWLYFSQRDKKEMERIREQNENLILVNRRLKNSLKVRK